MAKPPEQALETFESYRQRCRPIAMEAGLGDEFDASGYLEILEERVGSGMTDFWGISYSTSSFETEPMDDVELERKIRLSQACWTFFDGVAARVSPEMRRGPRGGGRDRDLILRHTIRTESEYFARQVGLRIRTGHASRGCRADLPTESVQKPARGAYRVPYIGLC